MSHAEHRSSELQLASSAASPAWVFIFCSKPQCHSQADASSGFSFSPQPGVVVQPHKVKRQQCPCIDQVLKSTCNLQQHERLQQHLHVQPVFAEGPRKGPPTFPTSCPFVGRQLDQIPRRSTLHTSWAQKRSHGVSLAQGSAASSPTKPAASYFNAVVTLRMSKRCSTWW